MMIWTKDESYGSFIDLKYLGILWSYVKFPKLEYQ